MTKQDALLQFQLTYGKQWYMMVNSPAFQAALQYLNEHGPNQRLLGLMPAEMIAQGTIIAANIQGWQDCLQTLRDLGSETEMPADLSQLESYLQGDIVPAVETQPAKPTRRKK